MVLSLITGKLNSLYYLKETGVAFGFVVLQILFDHYMLSARDTPRVSLYAVRFAVVWAVC